MQISRSFRGNDQKMMRRWTGSGIRSYRSSMRWNGSDSATMRAVISSNESGCRSPTEWEPLVGWRCVMNGHIWPDVDGWLLLGWNNPWQQDILRYGGFRLWFLTLFLPLVLILFLCWKGGWWGGFVYCWWTSSRDSSKAPEEIIWLPRCTPLSHTHTHSITSLALAPSLNHSILHYPCPTQLIARHNSTDRHLQSKHTLHYWKHTDTLGYH